MASDWTGAPLGVGPEVMANPRIVLAGAALTLSALVGGCSEKPNRLEIKGPSGTLAAQYGVKDLPVFEEKGASMKLRAVGYRDQLFIGAVPVRWTSEDPTVVSVNQAGVITILSSGETRVRAETEEGPALSDDIAVKSVIIDGIEITEPEVEEGEVPKLPMGELLKFEAVVKNDRGEVIEDAEIAWESTTYAATVGVDGTVEGRAIGKTTIIASAKNGDSDSVEMKVTDWPRQKRRRRR